MARTQGTTGQILNIFAQDAVPCRCNLLSALRASSRLALRTSISLLVFNAAWHVFTKTEVWITSANAGPSLGNTDDRESCAEVPSFPREEFRAQPDSSVVYTGPSLFPPSSIFQSVGLVRFITVFGIPIVATGRVGSAALSHASSLFADFLDNDRDGEVDNEEVVDSMKSYLVILGFLADSDESSEIWKDRVERPNAKAFKKQFECRFRFFELWRSDINPRWHMARRNYTDAANKGPPDVPRRKRCAEFRAETFDWPLWYFPFTIAYYGFLDRLDERQLRELDAAVQVAKTRRKFLSQYPDDAEMEKADFFAWTVLTKLGATECHCDSSDVGATWKICTYEELRSIVPDWIEIFETLRGTPRLLHDRMYVSRVVVGSGEEALV